MFVKVLLKCQRKQTFHCNVTLRTSRALHLVHSPSGQQFHAVSHSALEPIRHAYSSLVASAKSLAFYSGLPLGRTLSCIRAYFRPACQADYLAEENKHIFHSASDNTGLLYRPPCTYPQTLSFAGKDYM